MDVPLLAVFEKGARKNKMKKKRSDRIGRRLSIRDIFY
jgi:hypothetical protein